jgi:hypothetical protein
MAIAIAITIAIAMTMSMVTPTPTPTEPHAQSLCLTVSTVTGGESQDLPLPSMTDSESMLLTEIVLLLVSGIVLALIVARRSVSHQCYINVISMLYQYYINIVSISHQYRINIASTSNLHNSGKTLMNKLGASCGMMDFSGPDKSSGLAFLNSGRDMRWCCALIVNRNENCNECFNVKRELSQRSSVDCAFSFRFNNPRIYDILMITKATRSATNQ